MIAFGRLVSKSRCLTPPLTKIRPKSHLETEAAMPSPGRSSPHTQVRSLIVVSLRSDTRRCGLIRLPGCKLRPLSNPLPHAKKIDQYHFRSKAIPWPFQPPHPSALVDCGVIEVGDQVLWSNLSSWLQIATSILPPPPPMPKIYVLTTNRSTLAPIIFEALWFLRTNRSSLG